MIIYTRGWDPGRKVPAYAVGMTDRPDELLHYVMDVWERRRAVDAVRRLAEAPIQAPRTSIGPAGGAN